jgi:hypothetical protein
MTKKIKKNKLQRDVSKFEKMVPLPEPTEKEMEESRIRSKIRLAKYLEKLEANAPQLPMPSQDNSDQASKIKRKARYLEMVPLYEPTQQELEQRALVYLIRVAWSEIWEDVKYSGLSLK